MAVPYEKPIETLENVVQRTDRAHFCGGEIHFFKFLRKYFIITGGSYESSFSQATSPLRKKIYVLGKNIKFYLIWLRQEPKERQHGVSVCYSILKWVKS